MNSFITYTKHVDVSCVAYSVYTCRLAASYTRRSLNLVTKSSESDTRNKLPPPSIHRTCMRVRKYLDGLAEMPPPPPVSLRSKGDALCCVLLNFFAGVGKKLKLLPPDVQILRLKWTKFNSSLLCAQDTVGELTSLPYSQLDLRRHTSKGREGRQHMACRYAWKGNELMLEPLTTPALAEVSFGLYWCCVLFSVFNFLLTISQYSHFSICLATHQYHFFNQTVIFKGKC